VTHCPAETRHLFLHGLTLSILCMITYWLITRMLAHMISVSRNEDLLGGMWAVVATVFVYSYSYEESVAAALSRMGATSLSFALCFIDPLFFPSTSGKWPRGLESGLSRCLYSVDRTTYLPQESRLRS
jgi:hypothetical protein